MNIDLGLLLLRITAGGMVAWAHGLPKLMNYSQYIAQFGDPIGIGSALGFNLVIFAELVCAGLIVVGLFTRLALIPVLFAMFVAVFVYHASNPFNAKELPLAYLMMFLIIFITGPGRFSIQQLFKISAGRFTWFLK